MILVLLFSLAFASEHDTGFIADGFRHSDTKSIGHKIEVSVLGSDAANTLFKKLAQNPDIPFNYLVDGCQARATEMARIAEREGVQFGKIFAEGSLQPKTRLPDYPTARWGLHIAPVLYVTAKSGHRNLMVFDPGLFDRPVSVDQWKAKMLISDGETPLPSIHTYFGSRFQYTSRDRENAKTSWSDIDLAATSSTLQTYKIYATVPGGFVPSPHEIDPQELAPE